MPVSANNRRSRAVLVRRDLRSGWPCGRSYSAGVDTLGFESLILFVSDLGESRAFYAGGLELPVVFEDDVIVVVGGPAGRVVLHRNDRGHDERGIFPAGSGVGVAAVRFAVEDPERCQRQAAQAGPSTPVTVDAVTLPAAAGPIAVAASTPVMAAPAAARRSGPGMPGTSLAG